VRYGVTGGVVTLADTQYTGWGVGVIFVFLRQNFTAAESMGAGSATNGQKNDGIFNSPEDLPGIKMP